jgi:preprotein translocase subunit YajC
MKSKFKNWIPSFAGMMILFMHHSAWAMAGRPNADPNAPPPPEWAKWFPIVVMVAVFYFLIIRPQSRQRKDRDSMIGNIKKGDRIVTQGGLIATVVNVAGDTVDIKLNEDVKVKLRKSGVAEVLPTETVAEIVETGK